MNQSVSVKNLTFLLSLPKKKLWASADSIFPFRYSAYMPGKGLKDWLNLFLGCQIRNQKKEKKMQKLHFIFVLTAIFILLLLSDTTAKVIEMADTSAGRLIVTEDDDEQKLYLDDRPLNITDRFIRITRIIPNPGQDEVFLVSMDAGGSGTMPCYMFVIFKPSVKIPEISECIGSGTPERLESDGNRVSLRFGALHNRLDDELMEPECTVEYKNGKILKNGKPIPKQNKSESEGNSETESSGKPDAKNILKKQWGVTKTLAAGSDVVFFFFSEKCKSAEGELRRAEIRGSAGEDDPSGTGKLLEKGCWKADINSKQIIYVNPKSKITPLIQGFKGNISWQELFDLEMAN